MSKKCVMFSNFLWTKFCVTFFDGSIFLASSTLSFPKSLVNSKLSNPQNFILL